MHSLEEVLTFASQQPDMVMIVGGAAIYKDFLPYLDILYRTVIDEKFIGDAYFPEINWQEWQLVESLNGIVDEKNKYAHRFETYKRNK